MKTFIRCPQCKISGVPIQVTRKPIAAHDGKLGWVAKCDCNLEFEVLGFELNK